MEEPKIVNANEFEDLFAKSTTQTKKKPLSEAYEKKAKPKKVIKNNERQSCRSVLIHQREMIPFGLQVAVKLQRHQMR